MSHVEPDSGISVQSQLEQSIAHLPPGDILFPSDFLSVGSAPSLHMAFSRLEKTNKVIRLGKGIYAIPKTDPLLGPILPSLDAIAQAIAEKEQVLIRPSGSSALNQLGLSTQVPTKVVYLTNGSRRQIKIGKGTITFKPTTPKNLAAKNDFVFLAIQSLMALGPNGSNDKVVRIITEKLRQVPITVIRDDARHAPQFVSRLLHSIANQLAHHG